MAQIKEQTRVEEGMIVGYVRTNKQGSETSFEICTVEEWQELSDEDAEKVALEALWESGMIEWGY